MLREQIYFLRFSCARRTKKEHGCNRPIREPKPEESSAQEQSDVIQAFILAKDVRIKMIAQSGKPLEQGRGDKRCCHRQKGAFLVSHFSQASDFALMSVPGP